MCNKHYMVYNAYVYVPVIQTCRQKSVHVCVLTHTHTILFPLLPAVC